MRRRPGSTRGVAAVLLAGAAMLTACTGPTDVPAEASYDIVIRGGTIYDGSGAGTYGASIPAR